MACKCVVITEPKWHTKRVALALLCGKAALTELQRVKQTLLVDEGNFHDGFPAVFLAVHIAFVLGRIKVKDRRRRIRHQRLEGRRNQIFAERRQYAH